MKILNKKNIIKSIKIIIILANFIVLFFMYSFYDKYVYKTIVVDDDYIAKKSKQKANDINLEKFNETLKKLSQRKKPREQKEIKNIFSKE